MYLPTNNAHVATPPRFVKTQHNLQRMVSSPHNYRPSAPNATLATLVSDGHAGRIVGSVPEHRTTAGRACAQPNAFPNGDCRSRIVRRVDKHHEQCSLASRPARGNAVTSTHIPMPQSPPIVSRVPAHIPTPQFSPLQTVGVLPIANLNPSLPGTNLNLEGVRLPTSFTGILPTSGILPGASNLNSGLALQQLPLNSSACVPQQLMKTARDEHRPAKPSGTMQTYVAPTLAASPVGNTQSMLRSSQVSPSVGQHSNGTAGTISLISGAHGHDSDVSGNTHGALLASGAKPVLLPPRTNAARSTSPFPTHVRTLSAVVQYSTAKNSPSAISMVSEAKSSLEGATQVVISNHVLQVGGMLGKGSFGSVWAATCEQHGDVAIKEILGDTTSAHEKAILEVQLVNRIHCEKVANAELRIPKCLYWDTQKRLENEQWRIRMVLTRIPGTSLSSWMLKYLGDHTFSFHKATVMALNLLKQFAPTMHVIERCVYHRDVNSHNILVSEESGLFNFNLIDFGLAVDSSMWRGSDNSRRAHFHHNPSHTTNFQSAIDSRSFVRPVSDKNWKTLDIGGDCKYWPTASWKQFMWGWKSLGEDDVYHYRHRLDFHSLGITCYELIFYQATSIPYDDGTPELRQLIEELREVWAHYWTQSTHYWTQLFGTFTGKKDWKALRDLMRHSVTNAFQSNLRRLRQATSALLKTYFPPQWAHLKPLFSVLHDLIDTRGSFTWKNVEEIITDGAKNYMATRSTIPYRTLRRTRSIDTDATFSGRVADRDDNSDDGALVLMRENPSPRTHLRAKSDPAPPESS